MSSAYGRGHDPRPAKKNPISPGSAAASHSLLVGYLVSALLPLGCSAPPSWKDGDSDRTAESTGWQLGGADPNSLLLVGSPRIYTRSTSFRILGISSDLSLLVCRRQCASHLAIALTVAFLASRRTWSPRRNLPRN